MTSAERVLLETVVQTPEEMEAIARGFAARLRAGDLLVLTGPLGAGKTTFSRGLGEGLGVRGPVTSPTFVLARTHPSLSDGPPLIHVDAYRLSSAAELDDLDLDYAAAVTVVEWGEGFVDGVSESWLELTIERPLGAADAVAGTAAVDTDADAAAAIEGDDAGAAGAAEFAAPEPRRLRVVGHGPRWTGA